MTSDVTRFPATPSGGVRRAIPRPFQRPRIEAGGSERGVKRVWALIPAHRLKAGDVVPDIGRLHRVDEVLTAPPAGTSMTPQQKAAAITWTVTVHGGLNNTRTYQGSEPVYAFTVEAE